MKYAIRHTTTYRYTQPLLYSVQNLHLWPQSGPCQSVTGWHIRAPGSLNAQPDGQGNTVHSFSLLARAEENLRECRIEASGTVNTLGVSLFAEPDLQVPPAFFLRSAHLAEPHPRLAEWARSAVPLLAAALDAGRPPPPDALVALAAAVADRVRYRTGSTGVETTAAEAFDWENGVCQDQAHVMVAACRSLGLPARYVSGYFYAANEPELASHAWADVCLDTAMSRWLSLDVTHRCPTDERHIRLAAATDYTACAPVLGLRRGGGEESMDVKIQIEPVAG
jgi:transglutaminase-like putative cysteine protease